MDIRVFKAKFFPKIIRPIKKADQESIKIIISFDNVSEGNKFLITIDIPVMPPATRLKGRMKIAEPKARRTVPATIYKTPFKFIYIPFSSEYGL